MIDNQVLFYEEIPADDFERCAYCSRLIVHLFINSDEDEFCSPECQQDYAHEHADRPEPYDLYFESNL